jgi:hypothetical protein
MQSWLLAVHGCAAKSSFMLIFALALAQAAPAPRPLTVVENRDLGCIALLGLLADEQRRGLREIEIPDVTVTGKTYAGIVGARIVADSGLPREVIAQAIMTAADDARKKTEATREGKAGVRARLKQCLPLMQAELSAADAVNKPLPKPVPKSVKPQ